MINQLSENLYLIGDICNVYVIKKEDRAVLIDAGSGRYFNELHGLGVRKVEWVLHTHHHRDQCGGDHSLRNRGVKIAVPEFERYLFERAEEFWNRKRIYDNYNSRNTFFTTGKNIPVDAVLEDYGQFYWNGCVFQVLPAKGHTNGSCALIAEIDGQRIAFTGDLMWNEGKLYQIHAMEYGYADMIGLLFTHQSAKRLLSMNIDLVMPSHGPVITEPKSSIEKLTNRIRRLVRLTNPEKEECLDEYLYPISDHLLWGGANTCSNFYVIKSDSGNALLIDYGHAFFEHMNIYWDREEWEGMRFVAHHLDELFGTWGIARIDAVIPTHIHDDHTCGIPFLQKHYGVECWSLEQIADVLENPQAWSSTPCCFHEPIEVQRRFSDGKGFRWEEYEINVYHAPGQTEFHSTIAVNIDGFQIAFTGDNMYERPRAGWGSTRQDQPMQTQVFRNSFQLKMHRKCQEVMKRIAPDRICPGHGEPYEFTDLKLKSYVDYIVQKESLFRELCPEPAEQFVDLFWVRLIPYQATVPAGQELEYTLLLRNNFEELREFRARLFVPEGWSTVNDSGSVKLKPGSSGQLHLRCAAPHDVVDGSDRNCIRLVTAEVFIEGVSQGQVAEALVRVG